MWADSQCWRQRRAVEWRVATVRPKRFPSDVKCARRFYCNSFNPMEIWYFFASLSLSLSFTRSLRRFVYYFYSCLNRSPSVVVVAFIWMARLVCMHHGNNNEIWISFSASLKISTSFHSIVSYAKFFLLLFFDFRIKSNKMCHFCVSFTSYRSVVECVCVCIWFRCE